MDFKNPGFTLALFIILIIGSYVELTFGGSGYLSIIFFIISLILLARLLNHRGTSQTLLKPTKKLTILGSVIIIADVLYNFRTSSDIQTLDTMLIFLGISFIAFSLKNNSFSNIGEFGIYFSSIFLLFFSAVYVLPSRLDLKIYDYYGFYATTLPSLFILQSMGISLKMDSLTTFHVYGIEDIFYKIDLGCFGFYSILLIISTVLAYRLTQPAKNNHSLAKIVILLVIASYLANLLRIIALVSIGYYYGKDTMLLFHTFLGWALFAGIVLPIAYFFLRTTSEPDGTIEKI
ncbi:MAG: archaeosortase C [Candidatus Methanoperedens sp.]|nr:archaeosortase C [Candidatus Methanoperedens sp.]